MGQMHTFNHLSYEDSKEIYWCWLGQRGCTIVLHDGRHCCVVHHPFAVHWCWQQSIIKLWHQLFSRPQATAWHWRDDFQWQWQSLPPQQLNQHCKSYTQVGLGVMRHWLPWLLRGCWCWAHGHIVGSSHLRCWFVILFELLFPLFEPALALSFSVVGAAVLLLLLLLGGGCGGV